MCQTRTEKRKSDMRQLRLRSEGSVQLGFFECPHSRLHEKMMPGTPVLDFSEEALRMAMRSMLQELSLGRESTGSGYSDLVRLELAWARELGGGTAIPTNVVMPTDGETSFKAFLVWLSTDRDRAKSLDTRSIVRQALTCCARAV